MKKNITCSLLITLGCVLLVACGNTEKTTQEIVTEEESVVEVVETTEEVPVEETDSLVNENGKIASVETEEIVEDNETETEEAKPEYTYEDTSAIMYAKLDVNVRSMPSTDGDILGGLQKGEEVQLTGRCNETGWFRIDYNSTVAYVSDSYLIEEPVADEIAINSDIIEQMADALAKDDYVTLDKLAGKYNEYQQIIAPYIVKQEGSDGGSKIYYQLPSSIGTIVLCWSEASKYGITVTIGMTHNDMSVGNAKAEENYDFEMRNIEHTRKLMAKHGVENYTPKKYEYGLNMFMEGDEWIVHNHAIYINNYQYTEVNTNGLKYDSIEAFVNGISSGGLSAYYF